MRANRKIRAEIGQDVGADSTPTSRTLELPATGVGHRLTSARALQQHLAQRLEEDTHWSARRSLLFVVGSSFGAWAIIGFVIRGFVG